MDLEPDTLRGRLRLGRAAFGLIALGVGLIFFNAAGFLAFLMTGDREILAFLQNPLYDWLVGSPITWTTVLGTFLLWGCFDDPSWRRRAGALAVMHLIDLGLWAVEHGEALGLGTGELERHAWLRFQLARGMGWVEFLLFVSLAADLIGRLEPDQEADDRPPLGQGALMVAVLGLIFWAVAFIDQTNWKHLWPLDRRPNVGPAKLYLTWLGSTFLLTVVSFQVTVLCLTACRHCARAGAALGPDESDAEELLRSRSESFGDDPDHWWNEPPADPWR